MVFGTRLPVHIELAPRSLFGSRSAEPDRGLTALFPGPQDRPDQLVEGGERLADSLGIGPAREFHDLERDARDRPASAPTGDQVDRFGHVPVGAPLRVEDRRDVGNRDVVVQDRNDTVPDFVAVVGDRRVGERHARTLVAAQTGEGGGVAGPWAAGVAVVADVGGTAGCWATAACAAACWAATSASRSISASAE